MIDYFMNVSPLICAIIASTFTFLLTSLGASVVFFIKNINKNILDYMIGLSAGIMLSASFFSLLSPAIESSILLNYKPYIICTIGFILGGIFLYLSDKIFDLYSKKRSKKYKEKHKSLFMLILSITLHNIPEGMAIGVSFGALTYNYTSVQLIEAFILALGIGIQNFPEGSAISLPLKANGTSSFKSFIIGSLSAIVEPISAIIGVILVMKITLVMPLLLSFAAGAMIYVIVCELIPETYGNKNKSLIGLITLLGFSIMMILDVALG